MTILGGISQTLGIGGLVTLAATAFLLYVLITALIAQRKLADFPGPPTTGYSRLWLFRQWLSARVHTAHAQALRTYGSPCKVGPDFLITDDCDVIRHVAGPRSAWTRSEWYTTNKFDPRQDTVFSTRDEKLHAELRAKEMGAYTGRDQDLEPGIDATITDLLNLIRKSYNQQPLDLSQVTRMFGLDVLGRLLYGQAFGNLAANEEIYRFGDELAGMLPIYELMQNHSWFFRLMTSNLVQKLLAPKNVGEAGFGKIVAYAKERVQERFEPGAKPRKDMLGWFVSKGLSQLQCEAEAPLQILAGSDSTATVFRNTMWLLISSPRAYGRLKSEVDEAVASGRLTVNVLTYDEAKTLKYLDACIWEGIRMYPPLFGMKTKVAPEGGDTIKGVFYPGGTQLGFCDEALCRKESEWGSDSNAYRPERWTEANEEQRQRYETIVSCIFGAGKYTCLGKHIAYMELYKLVRNFDWAISDPMRPIIMVGHTAWNQRDMFVTPDPRTR